MNPTDLPTPKHLKDYQPSNFLITTVELLFDLTEIATTVTATMQIRKNPLMSQAENNLYLNGEAQKLISIKLNDIIWPTDQYTLTEHALMLLNVPNDFKLQITSTIKPQENTELSGLYKSKNMFCTQCEPEGFRRIMYFLDRPDVLATFQTKIIADKTQYPQLLSNGNLIEHGNLVEGKHYVIWNDPFKKPCYLFAMVAGDLDFIEDQFTTQSKRIVTLRIFTEKNETEKCRFIMQALKKAMRWDEENYGREYDLDIFMIVAIRDFNMGAMENKGLNIFNTKYVFANPETTTDAEYARIEDVVAHEYFHNWTGDRVTCRDWFQLCLKEGLTVFRDQSFSEDIGSKAVRRIENVQHLRTAQFLEDAGPLAHPIRPESYIEINNFYTMTVYEKGAEVIRMLQTILGKAGFRRGMDLYFKRHDGIAATCEDFVASMEDANHADLSQFRLWYTQAGTPALTIRSTYDSTKKQYQLMIEQYCPATPDQTDKRPMHIPLALGLLDRDGNDIPLNKNDVIHIKAKTQTVTFDNIETRPTLSLLRYFSAPIKIHYDYSDETLAFLMAHDKDDFARFEASQHYAIRMLSNAIQCYQDQKPFELDDQFINAMKKILLDVTSDKALLAYMLQLPSEVYIGSTMHTVDVDAIHAARQQIRKTLARRLETDLLAIYQKYHSTAPYHYNVNDMARRSLKNTCLHYLCLLNHEKYIALCFNQFQQAHNMTDKLAALTALSHLDCTERQTALQQFYDAYQHDDLVIDKWFAIQAASILPNTAAIVEKLLSHTAFHIKNPNRVCALLVNFSVNNPVNFHVKPGKGYQLLADQILAIDKFNPQVAAKITKPFTDWRRYDTIRKVAMKTQLEKLLNQPELSKNVYEIASKSLENTHGN